MQTEALVSSDTTIDVEIKIRLNRSDYERVLSTGQDFERVAAYLIDHYSKGGVMLRPSHTQYLEQLSGMPVKTPESVLQLCENSQTRGSTSGGLTVSYTVDPAFAEPLEQLAVAQSRSVEEILNEAMTIVFTNGWLYALDCKGLTLNIAGQDMRDLQSAMGSKTPTGSEVVEWVKKNQPNAKAAPEPKRGSFMEKALRPARTYATKAEMKADIKSKIEEAHA
jgi:hypothetical protein